MCFFLVVYIHVYFIFINFTKLALGRVIDIYLNIVLFEIVLLSVMYAYFSHINSVFLNKLLFHAFVKTDPCKKKSIKYLFNEFSIFV